MINERVNESISRSIFNATRTGKSGNGFNKIMRTGNGFNKGLGLGNTEEREICLKQLEHAFG